jgi:hypothetical protein
MKARTRGSGFASLGWLLANIVGTAKDSFSSRLRQAQMPLVAGQVEGAGRARFFTSGQADGYFTPILLRHGH